MKRTTVLLADDHRIVLEGLRGVLADSDLDLVGSVTDGRQLLEEGLRLSPDVIIVDVSMPLLNGIDAVKMLREQGCTAKIVFLTMHTDPTYATRALQAGGSAYVLKHSASDELVTAIREVLRGNTYVSPSLRSSSLEEQIDPTRRHGRETIELTTRQREVLQLLAEGKSAKEIAAVLDISARTVEAHKYRMMDDLGLKSSAQLVQYAIKHGIVSV